ncbi:hypothetical protein EVAR_65510_1 [Eumeta japonica]|uniref:DUF5641 domain-containing protein n=1 Tax=Eumeta variegata TaxID=151549 RepID=A0A4C1ZKH8_EUMVA|nr:hypothetical protein EVAR_65510_1 [Eumeta japonica]
MSGAWKRLVQSIKRALAFTLYETYPREEVFATLLLEAEYTVNSRPLTHMSVSADDLEVLTPNHFLLGSTERVPVPGSFSNSYTYGRQQWRHARRLADLFWTRWVREYLPTLQYRRKPVGRGDPLAVGDIVIVVDGTLPRNAWNFLCLIDDDAENRVTSNKKEIQQDLSGDEELPSQVAASVRLMKAAMDVDHEKLLSGDISFKWQRDFTAFTAVREEFLVHPVVQCRIMILLDIFDDDIMKEIVIETNRYAHQVIDKAKAVGIHTTTSRMYRWKDTIVDELYRLFAVFFI